MRNHWKPDLQGDLSRFLIAYLMMLLGILLAVHVLPPKGEGPSSSSRSPVHQDRQTTMAKEVVATQAGALGAFSSLEAAR